MKGISGRAAVCVSRGGKCAAGVVSPGGYLRITGRYLPNANRPAPQMLRSKPIESALFDKRKLLSFNCLELNGARCCFIRVIIIRPLQAAY